MTLRDTSASPVLTSATALRVWAGGGVELDSAGPEPRSPPSYASSRQRQFGSETPLSSSRREEGAYGWGKGQGFRESWRGGSSPEESPEASPGSPPGASPGAASPGASSEARRSRAGLSPNEAEALVVAVVEAWSSMRYAIHGRARRNSLVVLRTPSECT